MEAPSISLPKGGGAIRGIDEKFTVNPSNGTVSLTLTLPFTPARDRFVPPVRLSYDSGGGNSVVGLGWSLGVGSIRRRTEQQLPTYGDEDVFVFAGAEDLVPAAVWDGAAWREAPPPPGPYRVRLFRPRVERGFARIELISDPVRGVWWRVTSRDNVTTYFGVDNGSRVVDPAHPARIFEWLPSCSLDDKGNVVVYEWVPEDLAGVGPSLAESNRQTGSALFANRHLKRVRYGNRTPVFIDPNDPYRPPVINSAFLFEAVVDYGEHDQTTPTPDPVPGRLWPARSDPFSSYRPGFDLRTYRLVQRILMFHSFDELEGGTPTLVRSLDLSYAPSAGQNGPGGEITNLVAATQRGYVRLPDGTYAVEALPPTEFQYQDVAWDSTSHSVGPASVAGVPSGVGGSYQWVDLFGEGLAGIFSEQPGSWWYKRNLGDVDETGSVVFDRSRAVIPKPSFAGVSSGVVQIQDLDANGLRQIVVRTPEVQGFFEHDDADGWHPFVPFPNCLRVDLHDRQVRTLDLVGDGRADLLVSEQDAFIWYRSTGTQGHLEGGRTPKTADEERGPAVVFADITQTVFLADMSGDGLVDIARIRNGEVCYWPNLGYGRFGAKVSMDAAPWFDEPEQFDASRVRLADLTGTGASDLLYTGGPGCRAWLNLSGNGWSGGQPIPVPLPPSRAVDLSTTDLLGNGTTCLVWSSGLPNDSGAPMRYIDPMGGHKPHLLRGYTNNLGKEVVLSYKSSTWFRLQDERNGSPWRTRLAFPVLCLRRVETKDLISGTRLVTDYRYHHGTYDATEREFRGFGMVEQLDAEEAEHWVRPANGPLVDSTVHCPPMLTKTWFHTGLAGPDGTLLARYGEGHWDAEMRRAGFPVVANEPDLPDGRLVAGPGGPAALVATLGPVERREALRTCKGQVLRTEVFALDAPPNPDDAARRRQLSPYTVMTKTYDVSVLQPVVTGGHAVFSIAESESLTRNYERQLDDPRAVHRLNVRVDEVGNVLEAATVAYGRQVADPSLPAATRTAQGRPQVTYALNEYTLDAPGPVDHRLRLPSRSTTYEIRGLAPAAVPLFGLSDFDRTGFHVLTDSIEVPSLDDSMPPPGTVSRRMLHSTETVYLDATLAAARPLHELDPRGLVYERYELALTPEMVAQIYAGRVTPQMLTDGGYVQRDGAAWWVPSGRLAYLNDGEAAGLARDRFFTPVGHVGMFGVRTQIQHHDATQLLMSQVTDATGNRTRVDAFDFRTLTPVRATDPNDNVSTVVVDALGRVKASAVMGKGAEADALGGLTAWTTPAEAAATTAFFAADSSVDLATIGSGLLGSATARYLHDPHAFQRSGGTLPPVLATISREQHAAVQAASPVQIGFEYSNGLGKVELQKVQAEAGVARRVTVHPDNTVVVEDVDTTMLVPPRLRWLGNGRAVRDAKGRTIKEYEPFFSTTPRFESFKELVESGVTHIRTYDPLDRLIRVDHPDGTFSRTDAGAWHTVDYDRNDTVLQSDWYRRRINHEIDARLLAEGRDPAREADAAVRTQPHAGTPVTRHFDALGHPILEIQDAGRDAANIEVLLPTISVLDPDGRTRSVVDARGVATIAYDRDLRGTVAAYRSADGGNRWMLADARGEPLRSWDQRNHAFTFLYDDPLHRLTAKRVEGGDGPVPLNHIFERRVYGEGLPNDTLRNLRTKVAVLYDTAGSTVNLSFDFKGNLASSQRRFAADHQAVPDWSGPTPANALGPATFTSSGTYDALGRVTQRTTADGSLYQPTYNPANLLDTVSVTQNAVAQVHVKRIDYDELGRRRSIRFGNDVTVTYAYDRETFRLLQLKTLNAAATALQDLHYTYDPEGNVTHLEDRCVPATWFANQMTNGVSTYRYDPLYQLIEATGREHIAQVDFGAADNWADLAFVQQLNPNDVLTWRNYTQSYRYDPVGNLAEMAHTANAGNWTRGFTYAGDSNRLLSTHVNGSDYAYASHPAHGYLVSMPHLSVMRWGVRDELQAVATQVVNQGTPETTWYVYDGDGTRVRKVVERAAAQGATPIKKVERFYLDGVEIAIEYDVAGVPATERHTFHVNDDHQRVALVETEHLPANPAPTKRLVRYLSPDHLDSTQVETDDAGNVVAYEVFHPFGSSAYQATASAVGPPARRYRYTGMERDEESGLEYHGARYYAAWLGRWIAPDEHPDTLDGNRFAYVKNNPMAYRDPNGRFEEPVHGALTYRLALAAGFSAEDAATIAIATAGMDHDAKLRPGDGIGEMQSQILIGRTQINHYPSQETALARVEGDIKDGVDDLRKFGRDIHSLEDVGFKDAAGPHSRGVSWLAPTLFVASAVGAGLGVLAAVGASKAFAAGGAWTAAAVVLTVVAVALFAFALYALIFGLVGAGTGHPTYKTEKEGWSFFFLHTADRAFSDPEKNTKEMMRVFGKLKEAAKALNPDAVANEADARAAIKETVEANTQKKIDALLGSTARDSQGKCVASYAEIRTHAPWADREPDVSFSKEKYIWNKTFMTCPVR